MTIRLGMVTDFVNGLHRVVQSVDMHCFLNRSKRGGRSGANST